MVRSDAYPSGSGKLQDSFGVYVSWFSAHAHLN